MACTLEGMPDVLMTATVFALTAAMCTVLGEPWMRAAGPRAAPLTDPRDQRGDVGIGTVRSAQDPITVEVESTSGGRFVGRLLPPPGGPQLPAMRPGVVLLVTFDPAARDRLSLADDMAAVRTAFDHMLVRRGLVTTAQLALIRYGIRARAVVTAMATTGVTREDYREVELDLMVRRPAGGQFPAHETTLIPGSGMDGVAPGCVIDAYYAHDDESSVAVCVPPG